MTDVDRRAVEKGVRTSCAQIGADVAEATLMKVRAMPDMEDGQAFAASIGDIAAIELRAWIARERAALADLRAGIEVMAITHPRVPSGKH